MAFSFFKAIKGILLSEEGTLTPKQLQIQPGGTSGTKTTVTGSQTVDRTVTLPDATDTLVGKATTDTLTNKTIVVANNIVTTAASGNLSSTELNAALSELQTDIDTRATSAALTAHITNSTGAHAASAISNTPSGNLSSTDQQSANNELQSDIDTRATTSALTAHTSASSNVHGVTGSVVGTTDTQTLTNKTLTSPVINTPTGITKSDVGLGNVDNTSDATKNAAVATLTNKTINGTNNTITNVSLTTGVTGTLPINNGGTNATTANTALNNLLPSQTSNANKVLQTDGTNSSWATISVNNSVTGVKTSNYTATTADNFIKADASSSGFTITLYTAIGNTGRVITITRVESVNVFGNQLVIDGNGSETINGSLTINLSTAYESVTIVSDGSNWQIQDRRIPGKTVSYVPTTTGLGTLTNTGFYFHREGSYWYLNASCNTGTVTASNATISLPSGITLDTTKLASGYNLVGTLARGSNSATDYYTVLALSTDVNNLYFSRATSTPTSAAAGNTLFGSGDLILFWAKIPISGWES